MKDLQRLYEGTENEILFHNSLREILPALFPNEALNLIKNKTLSPLVSDNVNLI